MSRRRGDLPEGAVRRVYAYVAYRLGPGAPAEALTRQVLAQSANSDWTNVSLISTARQAVDQRFGPSERDRELVALHLAGLDVGEIAAVLRFRPGAAAVALRRALTRLEGGPDEPPQELVDEIAVTWKGPSRRRSQIGRAHV